MKNLFFKINNQNYSWPKQYITGAEVKELGSIPNEELLFLEIKKPWEDELVENHEEVDLAEKELNVSIQKSKMTIYHLLFMLTGKRNLGIIEKLVTNRLPKLHFQTILKIVRLFTLLLLPMVRDKILKVQW